MSSKFEFGNRDRKELFNEMMQLSTKEELAEVFQEDEETVEVLAEIMQLMEFMGNLHIDFAVAAPKEADKPGPFTTLIHNKTGKIYDLEAMYALAAKSLDIVTGAKVVVEERELGGTMVQENKGLVC